MSLQSVETIKLIVTNLYFYHFIILHITFDYVYCHICCLNIKFNPALIRNTSRKSANEDVH